MWRARGDARVARVRQAELAHGLESYVKQQPHGASAASTQDGPAARTPPRPDGEAAGAVSAGSGHKRECSGGPIARDAEGEMKRSRSINSELKDLQVKGSPPG